MTTYGKKRLEYYVNCFNRDLVLYINQDEEANVRFILDEAYDYWMMGEDELGDECCEEYMCRMLKENEIEFIWINEGANDDDE